MKFPAFAPIDLKEDNSPAQLTTLLHWQIVPNENQPRKSFDEKALEELSISIKQCGILQPLIVRKLNNDTNQYQLIAGERRWRAAKLINLLEIPVVIKIESEQDCSVIAIIENVQREDLNPIELAEGLQKLYEEHQLSHEKIGQMIGKSRAAVTNFLRLLILPEQIRCLLRDKEIEIGHARSLLTLPIDQQVLLAQKITNEKLSVRETEKLVQNIKSIVPTKKAPAMFEEEVYSWTEKLTQCLSTKVSVKINDNGEGNVTIHFGSPDEIDWLINKLT